MGGTFGTDTFGSGVFGAGGGLAGVYGTGVYGTSIYAAPSQVITFATTVGGLPYDTSQVPAYEAEAGRHFNLMHWFQPWQDGGVIQGWNTSYANSVVAGGRLALMTLEAWDVGNQGINPYPITSIAAGSFDNQIRDWWAVPIRNWGQRLLIRPFHEMNGNWYPWGYQASLSPGNTAAQIVAAWKRLVDVFRANGANNVEWVWCPNFDISGSWPPQVSVFYPGDSYVDWLAVDAYNNNDPFDTLTNKLTPVYNQIIALNATKPFMVPEWGCKEGPGANDKATWVTNSAAEWSNFPRISAAVYFNSGPWAFGTGNAASRTSALATFPFAPYDIPLPLAAAARGSLVSFVAATTAGGSGVTSLACNVPAGVLNGDLLIAFVTRYASTPNAVTGWTRLADYSTGTTGDADTTVSVFYRTAASEPASYTFTAPSSGSNWFSIEMTAYRNVAAALWDVVATSATGNSSSASAPSITPVTDKAMHLAHWSAVPHMNGVPAGYAADNPVSDSGVASAHKQITPVQASGAVTQALGFAGTWVGVSLAFRPKQTGAYGAAVVGDGALGFYRLQETSGTVAADSGYGGNAGTISATGITYNVTPAPVADAGARCFTFNGTSGYIDLGNPAAFQLSNVTLATWIKTSNADGLTHGVFVKANAWGLFMNANHFATYDWTGAAWRDTGVAINDGAWHLLQMSVQSGVSNGTKLYIDGVLKLTTTLTVSAQTKNLLIGAGDVAGGFPQYWGGQLAEPSITAGVIA